jgi:hypothetical protein
MAVISVRRPMWTWEGALKRLRLLLRCAVAGASLVSCAEDAREVSGYPGAILNLPSPSGRTVASVVEANTEAGQLTQVLLAFDRCGVGPVSVSGLNAGLELEWRNDTILEVRHPPESVFLGSVPSEPFECGGDAVRVVLVPTPRPTP